MKKRILLGANDVGNGHISRQKCIIHELQKCNVELVLAVTEKSIVQYEAAFPEIKKIRINIPWIQCENDGIDFKETLNRYRNTKMDQFESFLEFAVEARQCFDGCPPDIVMTDFEANVTWFAYAMDLPLICLDQQSKLLYIGEEEIDGITIARDRALLRFYFPKADHRFISSFYPIDIEKKEEITVLPPVIRNLKKEKMDRSKIVVYFSPFTNDVKLLEQVLDMLTERTDYHFVVYSKLDFKNYEQYPHLTFKRIGETFENDISDCCCILSSAGHQLISEAISLDIPLYVFTFPTYDQKYCAKMVERYKLGKTMRRFDQIEFDDFLQNLELYRRSISAFRKKYWTSSWDDVMLDVLNEKYGIHRM